MNQRLTTLLSLPLLVALTITGCSSIAPAEESSSASGAVEAEPAAAEEAPAEEIGTRANPAPAGTVVEVSSTSGIAEYQVTIGAVTINANDLVATANQFNEPAPDGFQYLMFPVTYTYVGTETGTPWLDVNLEFVSAAGTTHTTSDSYVSVDSPLSDINELYPQAAGTGNVVLLVPSADVEAGLLTVSDLFGSSKFFVKLA
jgi:hypothetical protein